MLKNISEKWYRNIGGRRIRVFVKFKETKEAAKACSEKARTKYGCRYRIETVTAAMRKNHWAGIPHGAKYMVTYWRKKS
jgi:hypothetical protein